MKYLFWIIALLLSANSFAQEEEEIIIDLTLFEEEKERTLTIVEKEGKWGVANKKGKEIIPLIYDKVYLQDGIFYLQLNGKEGLADKNGKEIVPVIYDRIGYPSHHFYVVIDEKYGIVNNEGVQVAPCEYDSIDETFTLGFKKDKVDLFDEAGNVVYSTTYKDARVFYGITVAIKKDKKWGFVDLTGKEITPFIYDDINASNIAFFGKKDKKWAILSKEGKEITPFIYDDIDGSSIAVFGKKGEKWAILSKEGKEITPFVYDEIYSKEEVMAAKKNGKWGFVDKTGKEITPFVYDETEGFSEEGFVSVRKNNYWGFVYKDGREIFRNYIEVSSFSNGLARVTSFDNNINDSISYYIDGAGKRYDFKSEYYETNFKFNGWNRAIYKKYNNRYTLIDEQGNDMTIGFDEIIDKKIHYQVKYDNKWGTLDPKGKEIIPTKYHSIDHFKREEEPW